MGFPVGQSSDLPTNALIAGRYQVDHILGRGGMGAVYRVHHVNTGEALALKVLNPALASNAQAVERFRTEARAPVRIGTDHVVRIVDADVSAELGGVPFLVMELLIGRDLGTEQKRRGAIPAGEVVLYLRQVARALDKAHSLGIIHRDLKPANLYLTQRDDGSPLIKILDFGIAKLTDGISAELTQDGTIFGTPWYMSPEQARGYASKVGPSADLWALGLIAFRLLTGRNYWTAEGMAALIGQIVYDPMLPPSQMVPFLGPRFDAWFARACNREIEGRFSSAAELVRSLSEALGVPTDASHSSPFEVSINPATGFAAASATPSSAPGTTPFGMGLSQVPSMGSSQPSMGSSQVPSMGSSQPSSPSRPSLGSSFAPASASVAGRSSLGFGMSQAQALPPPQASPAFGLHGTVIQPSPYAAVPPAVSYPAQPVSAPFNPSAPQGPPLQRPSYGAASPAYTPPTPVPVPTALGVPPAAPTFGPPSAPVPSAPPIVASGASPDPRPKRSAVATAALSAMMAVVVLGGGLTVYFLAGRRFVRPAPVMAASPSSEPTPIPSLLAKDAPSEVLALDEPSTAAPTPVAQGPSASAPLGALAPSNAETPSAPSVASQAAVGSASAAPSTVTSGAPKPVTSSAGAAGASGATPRSTKPKPVKIKF